MFGMDLLNLQSISISEQEHAYDWLPLVRADLLLALRECLEHDGTVRLTDERCRAAGRRGGVHEVDLLQKAWRTQHRARPLNLPNHHPTGGSPLIPTDTLKRAGIGFLRAAIAGLECTPHVPGLAQRARNGFFLVLGSRQLWTGCMSENRDS
jgi:hypothetical protein